MRCGDVALQNSDVANGDERANSCRGVETRRTQLRAIARERAPSVIRRHIDSRTQRNHRLRLVIEPAQQRIRLTKMLHVLVRRHPVGGCGGRECYGGQLDAILGSRIGREDGRQ